MRTLTLLLLLAGVLRAAEDPFGAQPYRNTALPATTLPKVFAFRLSQSSGGSSRYGQWGGLPGNVLLAFSVDGR
jgi:hypothetical protein